MHSEGYSTQSVCLFVGSYLQAQALGGLLRGTTLTVCEPQIQTSIEAATPHAAITSWFAGRVAIAVAFAPDVKLHAGLCHIHAEVLSSCIQGLQSTEYNPRFVSPIPGYIDTPQFEVCKVRYTKHITRVIVANRVC